MHQSRRWLAARPRANYKLITLWAISLLPVLVLYVTIAIIIIFGKDDKDQQDPMDHQTPIALIIIENQDLCAFLIECVL